MAYASSQFGQQTQRETKISSQQALPTQPYFDDDESAILDPAILDADIMRSPSERQFRKGSLTSNGVLSPADSEGWAPQYADDISIEPHSAGGLHAYHPEQHHSGYYGPGIAHPPVLYAHQQHAHGAQHGRRSSHATPHPAVEAIARYPQQYDGHQYASHQRRADSARGSFSQAMAPLPPAPQLSYHPGPQHSEPSYAAAPPVESRMSPHCHQDWMNLAQQEVEARPASKRMRPASPRETTVDFQRRDGIRKKNGRIDIPHERNIESIDHMIESTTDENMLKELKQQKRLLRNREAALASRQRKKKHTEDLESREKEFSRQMGGLHDQLQALNIDRQKLEHQHGVLFHQYEEQRRINEALELEKRDMIMKHNEETSSLRRKIQVLEKDLDNRPDEGLRAPPMSAEPSSSGFTDINGDLEALNMGPTEWDHLFLNDVDNDSLDNFAFDTLPEFERPAPVVEKKTSSSTIVPSPTRKAPDGSSDPPIASGLLFFLLLCGAFVASKPASSRPADLPQVPPDVRAAAPKVLGNLLAENSVVASRPRSSRQSAAPEPSPSHIPPPSRSRSSRLDQVHQRITSPTKQQEIDAAAALTPAQYASLTNMDYAYADRTTPSPQQPRPSLAEALANMQGDNPRSTSKAEVYTRSLLWDQIPLHVVQQFREVIRDHEELESSRQQQTRRQGSFKLEQ